MADDAVVAGNDEVGRGGGDGGAQDGEGILGAIDEVAEGQAERARGIAGRAQQADRGAGVREGLGEARGEGPPGGGGDQNGGRQVSTPSCASVPETAAEGDAAFSHGVTPGCLPGDWSIAPMPPIGPQLACPIAAGDGHGRGYPTDESRALAKRLWRHRLACRESRRRHTGRGLGAV